MARVIRAGESRVIPVAVADARGEAERIVAEAHREAARVREAQRRTLTEQAREAARAELAAAHLELERARVAVLEEARGSVAPLALAVARHLVGDAIEAEPERVRALVADAMRRVQRAERARVRVHPKDAAQLLDAAFEVVADPAIERGGCVVESDLGEVDARLEVRLDALARALSNGAR